MITPEIGTLIENHHMEEITILYDLLPAIVPTSKNDNAILKSWTAYLKKKKHPYAVIEMPGKNGKNNFVLYVQKTV